METEIRGYYQGIKDIIKIIDEPLKSNHNLCVFKIQMINKHFKDENISLDKSKINPEIRKRDSYLCHFCGRNVMDVNSSNTLHHIIPRRWSGKHNQENIITICCDCHNKLEKLLSTCENNMIEITLKELKQKIKELK